MLRIDTYIYIDELIGLLKQNFSSRLLYVGLQGSYLRGEADENSDIDIVVILDRLSIQDMDTYRNIISESGDKSCGFICGEPDIKNWNPCEICQLIHTTKDYYGRLSELVPTYTAGGRSSESDEDSGSNYATLHNLNCHDSILL